MPRFSRVFVGFSALAASIAAVGAQAPAAQDPPFKGSALTRQQVLEKLTSATPGTKPSVDEGKAVFDKTCAGCHIIGDRGNSIGPDLTTVGSRFKKADMLRSIMWPSETVSDQYSMTMFELNNGDIVSGLIYREDARFVYVRNADHMERPLPIAVADIKERAASVVSPMPEGLMDPLTLDQIDGLADYLLLQK